VHLVGFTIEIYYGARSYKRQIWGTISLTFLQPTGCGHQQV